MFLKLFGPGYGSNASNARSEKSGGGWFGLGGGPPKSFSPRIFATTHGLVGEPLFLVGQAPLRLMLFFLGGEALVEVSIV